MLDTGAYLLFAGFGLYSTLRNWRNLQYARASVTWPHTTGEVTTSEKRVQQDEEGETERGFIIYQYNVLGIPYWSGRIFYGDDIWLGMKKYMRRYLSTYPVGKKVRVYYDPAAPSRAVLRPGLAPITYFPFLVSSALTVWGIVTLLIRSLG